MAPTDPQQDTRSRVALQRWIPGIGLASRYEAGWLRFDAVAGVVLAAILVPQGMAYAELAGLPPVTGLYTAIACLVAYAVFGPSRVLVLGPDSALSPMILAAITPLILVPGDVEKAIALAGMLAICVGLIEILVGVGRLGFVAGLLSKEVQVGYINGLAITLVVGQLPKLFGFKVTADDFAGKLEGFVTGLDRTHVTTLAVGLGVLAVLVVLPKVTAFPAVLVAVAGATIVSALLDLAGAGVPVVGALPRGLPRPQLPWTSFDDVQPLLLAALGIALVSLTDTVATATSFASRRGEDVDADHEMIGGGAANIASGLFQGFAVSTTGSRTAIVERAGAKSQVTGLAGATVVALLLVAFNGLFASLPQTALAAIAINASRSLVDVGVLRRYARVRRGALLVSLVATAGVVLLGVLQGIVLAIVLSILLFFRQAWWPRGAVLGYVPSLSGWYTIDRHPDGREMPHVVVYRWEAPLFFANAPVFRDHVRSFLADRPAARYVVLQCGAVTDIDVTAADMLERLEAELHGRGVQLVFVELRARLQELLDRYGLGDTLARTPCYRSIDEAVDAITSAADGGAVADGGAAGPAP